MKTGLLDIIGISLGVFVLIIAFVSSIFMIYEISKESSFCNVNHPEHDGRFRSYVSNTRTEIGYIECCRSDFVDHKWVEDCKVFKYD